MTSVVSELLCLGLHVCSSLDMAHNHMVQLYLAPMFSPCSGGVQVYTTNKFHNVRGEFASHLTVLTFSYIVNIGPGCDASLADFEMLHIYTAHLCIIVMQHAALSRAS